MADRENRNAVDFPVPAPPAQGRTVRVNVTMPEDVLRSIDSYAEDHGFTRSGFLVTAAKRAIWDA